MVPQFSWPASVTSTQAVTLQVRFLTKDSLPNLPGSLGGTAAAGLHKHKCQQRHGARASPWCCRMPEDRRIRHSVAEHPTPEDTWLLHNRITFGCSRGTAGSLFLFPHLSGIHDSAYSNCQSHGGHFGEVTIKEPGIGQYGVHGQGLHSCPGHQTGSRLVEGDVTIGADTWTGTASAEAQLGQQSQQHSQVKHRQCSWDHRAEKKTLQFLCSSSDLCLLGRTARAHSGATRQCPDCTGTTTKQSRWQNLMANWEELLWEKLLPAVSCCH